MKAAEKARVPALAGGVALLGLAGGVALSNRRRKGIFSGGSKRGALPNLAKRIPTSNGSPFSGGSKLSALPNLAKRIPTPNGSPANLLGDAVTEVAKGSSKVGDLASKVQKAAEAVSPESSTDRSD